MLSAFNRIARERQKAGTDVISTSSQSSSCHFHCSSTRLLISQPNAASLEAGLKAGASKVFGCGRRLHGFYQSSRVDSSATLQPGLTHNPNNLRTATILQNHHPSLFCIFFAYLNAKKLTPAQPQQTLACCLIRDGLFFWSDFLGQVQANDRCDQHHQFGCTKACVAYMWWITYFPYGKHEKTGTFLKRGRFKS